MENVLNNTATTPTFMSRIQRQIKKFQAARAERAAINRAYAEILYLSDRELMEYGLHRSDLFDLARSHVYRNRVAHF